MNHLEDVMVANPQHPHVALVLLLDNSYSMVDNRKIEGLNEGLQVLKQDLLNDELASKRVDIAVVTFGGVVKLNHPFSSVEGFDPPTLNPEGNTPMGKAISMAIDLIEERKKAYNNEGTSYYRPWIFMITDGEPTDMRPGTPEWDTVIQKIRTGEDNKKFSFWTVAVEPANYDALKMIAPPNRPPMKLNNEPGAWKAMFEWLSSSHRKVSGSKVGEQIATDNAGWGTIPT